MANKSETKKLSFALISVSGEKLKEEDIKKVSCVKLESRDRQFIYLEKLDDEDEWRLTYTLNTIPDIKQLKSIELIRSCN